MKWTRIVRAVHGPAGTVTDGYRRWDASIGRSLPEKNAAPTNTWSSRPEWPLTLIPTSLCPLIPPSLWTSNSFIRARDRNKKNLSRESQRKKYKEFSPHGDSPALLSSTPPWSNFPIFVLGVTNCDLILKAREDTRSQSFTTHSLAPVWSGPVDSSIVQKYSMPSRLN